jgi:hypothetical protein
MPSVTNVYTPPVGWSSGALCETTNTGRRAGPVGPSASHHGSESSYVRRPAITAPMLATLPVEIERDDRWFSSQR